MRVWRAASWIRVGLPGAAPGGGEGGAARETWLLFSLSLFSGELQVSQKGYSAGRD